MVENMLIDGEWKTDAGEYTDKDGEFQREETKFNGWIKDSASARFRPEPGRYHLYISRACPWAHGVVLIRRLCGLKDVFSMDIVDPFREKNGWKFSPSRSGCTKDSVNGFDYLYEVYKKADSNYTGRVSVPVLWDKKRDTIVNNESIDIMKMIEEGFKEYKKNDVDFYPEILRDEIDRIVEEIYTINNGVYKAGFADTQKAYDKAIDDLFSSLSYWDDILENQRYLIKEKLTLADIRLFPTLIRFDHVYNTHFKCNKNRIIDYDNLWPYLRDLYQTAGFEETVNMDHIKEHYYTTHTDINPKKIIAVGPNLDLKKPHNRDRLTG